MVRQLGSLAGELAGIPGYVDPGALPAAQLQALQLRAATRIDDPASRRQRERDRDQ